VSAIPFTLYDFFAYLSTGALWLLGIDYAFAMGWILGKEVGTGQTVVWVIVAYVLGHVNSHWSAWLFENKFVEHGLGYPSVNLFARSAAGRRAIVRRLFAHYLTPFPRQTAEDILDAYERLSKHREPGNAMFNFCFSVVKTSPVAYGRLQTFLATYGFARNMSFATLCVAGFFLAAWFVRGVPHLRLLALACVATAIVLFYRYLKFFRIYSLEIFTTLLGLRDLPSK
jgi:hypothetical protein